MNLFIFLMGLRDFLNSSSYYLETSYDVQSSQKTINVCKYLAIFIKKSHMFQVYRDWPHQLGRLFRLVRLF